MVTETLEHKVWLRSESELTDHHFQRSTAHMRLGGRTQKRRALLSMEHCSAQWQKMWVQSRSPSRGTLRFSGTPSSEPFLPS